jgi:DNA-binding NtrC family response regulator
MARKSILVVDDEKSQREILEMILSGEGYDVTTASSGEAAIKFVKERSFDLVLTDLKMTGMSGIELLQHVVALDSSTVVILWTGHGTIESAKEALRKGAYDYLEKVSDDREPLLQDGSSKKDDSESCALKLYSVDSWRVRHW